ncbi:unnamed protein product [Paramecium sonneborni]|uniref:Uncharacterized protein n=1 Tax=Paramecium sonneborni TaxID=65129 RepID=A0A8S1Q3F5_9CILI|nr:unnamed protein product [Paramecium sonneborni]
MFQIGLNHHYLPPQKFLQLLFPLLFSIILLQKIRPYIDIYNVQCQSNQISYFFTSIIQKTESSNLLSLKVKCQNLIILYKARLRASLNHLYIATYIVFTEFRKQDQAEFHNLIKNSFQIICFQGCNLRQHQNENHEFLRTIKEGLI